MIQQHARDAQQTLKTEISHGRSPWRWYWCRFLSCATAGLTPLAALGASAGCCQQRDAQQHMGEHTPPVAGGAETSSNFIHGGFAQLGFTAILAGWKTSPLSSLFHLPHHGSKPNLPAAVSLPVNIWANTPWYESVQLGSAQCRGLERGGEGGNMCGKGRGAADQG